MLKSPIFFKVTDNLHLNLLPTANRCLSLRSRPVICAFLFILVCILFLPSSSDHGREVSVWHFFEPDHQALSGPVVPVGRRRGGSELGVSGARCSEETHLRHNQCPGGDPAHLQEVKEQHPVAVSVQRRLKQQMKEIWEWEQELWQNKFECLVCVCVSGDPKQSVFLSSTPAAVIALMRLWFPAIRSCRGRCVTSQMLRSSWMSSFPNAICSSDCSQRTHRTKNILFVLSIRLSEAVTELWVLPCADSSRVHSSVISKWWAAIC